MQFARPVSYEDLALVFISIIIGLVIGAEREYHNKTAGLRTLMLVSVGSCIFTILSLRIGVANPDRLAANIVTGIGFLGAGAIFRDDNKVSGLTTACTIWVTAALGMSIGSGHIYLGMLGSVIVLFVLAGLSYIEKWIDKLNRSVEYIITTEYVPDVIPKFESLFRQTHLRHHIALQSKSGNMLTIHWRISGSRQEHKELEKLLLNDATIINLQF